MYKPKAGLISAIAKELYPLAITYVIGTGKGTFYSSDLGLKSSHPS